jgi:hypothetical protein
VDDLLHMMLMTKMWHTTDPRDHLFVLREFHRMFEHLSTGYSDTVEAVYTDATAVLLHIGGTWSQACRSRPSVSPYFPS